MTPTNPFHRRSQRGFAIVLLSASIGCTSELSLDNDIQDPHDLVEEQVDLLEESKVNPTKEVLTKAFMNSFMIEPEDLAPADLEALVEAERAAAAIWDPLPSAQQLAPAFPQDTLIGRGYCGARDSAGADALRKPRFPTRFLRTLSRPMIVVPVAFHVITDRRGSGHLTSAVVDQQIALLNTVFAPNFSFELESMEVTANDRWFRNGAYNISEIDADQMTNSLARTPERTMNVYSVACGYKALLGEASYPWFETAGMNSDGVIVHFGTLPGMGLANYDQGKTLVHEVGHYLGLYHTFHDGTCLRCACDSPAHDGCTEGDLVDDTPPQKYCHQEGCGECDNGKVCDTCPGPGVDQVANYMGYNPDACMTLFSSGQIDRMVRSVQNFRPAFIQ